jgi:hypothetical protein
VSFRCPRRNLRPTGPAICSGDHCPCRLPPRVRQAPCARPARRPGAPAAACDRQSGPDCCAAVTYLHTRPQAVVNFPGVTQVPAVTVVHPRTIGQPSRTGKSRHACRPRRGRKQRRQSRVPVCARWAGEPPIICSIAVCTAVLFYCVTRGSDARDAGQRAATACGNSAGAGIMPG